VLKVEGFLKLEFGLKIHFFGNFIVNIPIFWILYWTYLF
jgi:hypothetical protein